MNCGYNYNGCGCNSYTPNYASNPYGCGGCSTTGCGFGGQGNSWFAIVLVVFLLLIICGCTRMHG